MVHHSHEDALSEGAYDELVAATTKLDAPFEGECLTVLVLAGRLGLRAGEIAHLRSSWIDRDHQTIEIPRHSDCRTGEGDVCGYCRKRAESAVAHHDDLTLKEALDQRWNPKTANSARAVPYDFDSEIEAVVEAFDEAYDHWPTSRIGVNRRVDRVADAADYDDRIYPHCLRATAASWHAYRGVPPAALQAMFGWHSISVAEKYVRLSGEATSRALKDAHADD